jgi:hypothetical protein
MFGRALAWIRVEPGAILLTGSVTLVAPPANVTLDGTVATPVLSELKFIVRPPAGAGAESWSETIRADDPAVMVKAAGEKKSAAVTRTGWLADV